MILQTLIEFFTNQQYALLAAMLVPFLWKYLPAFKNYSNDICVLLAAMSAWATNVFGPTPANAGQLPLFGVALSPFAAVFLGLGEALLTKLVHDKILNPAYKVFGLKKPEPTRTV